MHLSTSFLPLLGASGFDVVQFIKVAVAAGFATMPFLTYWVMLNWNFRVQNVSYAKSFNIVGALFSTVLYSYYSFSEPKADLILANLYWFYVPAVLCTVGYFALYFLFSEDVQKGEKRWVLPLAMLQYIIVLSVFAVLVSIVLKHKEYYLVGGKVRLNGQPMTNQRVDWSVKYLPAGAAPQTLSIPRKTDDSGRYLVSMLWTEMPKLETDTLKPVIAVYRPGIFPYEERLDQWNHVPWNIDLVPDTGSTP